LKLDGEKNSGSRGEKSPSQKGGETLNGIGQTRKKKEILETHGLDYKRQKKEIFLRCGGIKKR